MSSGPPGGDEISFAELNHVTGDEVDARQLHNALIAAHADELRKQSLQRGDCLMCAPFLPEREDRVDDDDGDDRSAERAHSVAGVAVLSEQRQRRRRPENEGEEMSESWATS